MQFVTPNWQQRLDSKSIRGQSHRLRWKPDLLFLDEDEFGASSRATNAQAREEFADALRIVGLQVFPSVTNFLLAKVPRGSGAGLASWLESERILIRGCDSFRGLGDAYIRLAVLSRLENRRLVSSIKTWLRGEETSDPAEANRS